VFPQTLNHYSYALNNPETLNDPTGLRACGGSDIIEGCAEATAPIGSSNQQRAADRSYHYYADDSGRLNQDALILSTDQHISIDKAKAILTGNRIWGSGGKTDWGAAWQMVVFAGPAVFFMPEFDLAEGAAGAGGLLVDAGGSAAAATADGTADAIDTTVTTIGDNGTVTTQAVPATEGASVDAAKFSDYVFKEGATHGKDAIFHSYGYGAADSNALAADFEAQGAAQYRAGNYTLGKLDQYGQRVTIPIRLEGQGAAAGRVTTINTGWMIESDGSIRLLTPFAGFAP
jgi:hypothetical protein